MFTIINIVRGCMAEQINDKYGLTVKIHYKYHINEKSICNTSYTLLFFSSEFSTFGCLPVFFKGLVLC